MEKSVREIKEIERGMLQRNDEQSFSLIATVVDMIVSSDHLDIDCVVSFCSWLYCVLCS